MILRQPEPHLAGDWSSKLKSIQVNTYTSQKEVNGLFDFNNYITETILTKYLLTRSASLLINKEKQKFLFSNNYVSNAYTDEMTKIELNLLKQKGNPNSFNFIRDETKNDSFIWKRVVNDIKIKKSGINVKQGSYLKFGRQVIKVSEINTVYNNSSNDITPKSAQIDYNKFQNNQSPSNKDNSISKLRCKICLESESIENPFITDICPCLKQMPAHFDCLSNWFQKRCNIQKYNSMFLYNMDEIACDICTQKYPFEIEHCGEKRRFMQVETNKNKNYVILEVFNEGEQHAAVLIYIEMIIDYEVFSLGRSEKNHIVLKDTSISREHAFLVWDINKFVLFDSLSKFGTFIGLEGETPIDNVLDQQLVIGKFCFIFKARKKGKSFAVNSFYDVDPNSNESRLFEPKAPINISQENAESSFKYNQQANAIIYEENEEDDISLSNQIEELDENDMNMNNIISRQISKKQLQNIETNKQDIPEQIRRDRRWMVDINDFDSIPSNKRIKGSLRSNLINDLSSQMLFGSQSETFRFN